jgi:hypothetical protein
MGRPGGFMIAEIVIVFLAAAFPAPVTTMVPAVVGIDRVISTAAGVP